MALKSQDIKNGSVIRVDGKLQIVVEFLHKDEIIKIASKQKLQGYTCIPLRVYLKNGKAKLEIALAKGKTLYDKREDAKKKTMDRAAQRAIRR